MKCEPIEPGAVGLGIGVEYLEVGYQRSRMRVTTSRWPERATMIVGRAPQSSGNGAAAPGGGPSSPRSARKTGAAASLRRPSSRIVGRWCAGKASNADRSERAPSDAACAQRAPGRQPPPRGTEQAPGLSSTGWGKRGAARAGSGGVSCRPARRNRSIASCGRKSEATLIIARLQFEGERRPAALADELDRPAPAPDAR